MSKSMLTAYLFISCPLETNRAQNHTHPAFHNNTRDEPWLARHAFFFSLISWVSVMVLGKRMKWRINVRGMQLSDASGAGSLGSAPSTFAGQGSMNAAVAHNATASRCPRSVARPVPQSPSFRPGRVEVSAPNRDRPVAASISCFEGGRGQKANGASTALSCGAILAERQRHWNFAPISDHTNTHLRVSDSIARFFRDVEAIFASDTGDSWIDGAPGRVCQ